MVYKLSCSNAGRNYVHNYKAWHTEIRPPLNSTLCDVKPAEVNHFSMCLSLKLRLDSWEKKHLTLLYSQSAKVGLWWVSVTTMPSEEKARQFKDHKWPLTLLKGVNNQHLHSELWADEWSEVALVKVKMLLLFTGTCCVKVSLLRERRETTT